jgi:C-3',4' desaturase CrtD
MKKPDVIVIGAGLGGLAAGALLSKEGLFVQVLEAATVPGGCASSFEKDGTVFDTGATTLVGFEPGRPMHTLEKLLDAEIPKTKLDIPMAVHFENGTLMRYEDQTAWIAESIRFFGEPEAQRQFWKRIFELSTTAWSLSNRVEAFPPRGFNEWLRLPAYARLNDVKAIPSAFVSTAEFARRCGITHPNFFTFLDAQLMITTQSNAADTPLLFAAPALTYTNGANYYLEGGMIRLAGFLVRFIENRGGEVHYRHKVEAVTKSATGWNVLAKRKTFSAPLLVSNTTIWDMEVLLGKNRPRQHRYPYTGAFTMYFTVPDVFGPDAPLHHQLLCPDIPHGSSPSFFVSLSAAGDTHRAKAGMRAVNLSTHTRPEAWFGNKKAMLEAREETARFLINAFLKQFPGAYPVDGQLNPATPYTWQRWVFRKDGRVGGIPQSMTRMLWHWPDANPEKGLFMTGDTVFPGQGIPAVVLSGISAARRILRLYP